MFGRAGDSGARLALLRRPLALIPAGVGPAPRPAVPGCRGEGLAKGANSAGISRPGATLRAQPQPGEEFPPVPARAGRLPGPSWRLSQGGKWPKNDLCPSGFLGDETLYLVKLPSTWLLGAGPDDL